MFERLIDLLADLWEELLPGVIVDAYEAGAVLRLGVFHRKVGPGFRWKWPFVERVAVVSVCETTLRLSPQTLTTKDKQGVVVAAIIKYEIRDVEPYMTRIFDQNDVLADVAMGAVRRVVAEAEYAKLVESPPEDAVLAAVRKEVNQYGFKVHRITFTDLAKVHSIRFITNQPQDISN